MLETLGSHVRQNVIGCIALFFALSGGVAWATHPGGANTISSGDIIDNQVYSADVRNDTLTSGGLAAVDLRPNSVAQSEIAASGVAASEITNGAVGTAELANSIPAAHATHSTSQSVPDFPGAGVLAFDTERYDTASMHDNATNNSRLTAPVNGIYAVTAEVDWTPNATGRRELDLMKNGSTIIADDDRDGIPISFSGQGQSVTAQVRLMAGDFVEVGVLQTSGGPLNVTSVGETSPEFSMTWLAPGP